MQSLLKTKKFLRNYLNFHHGNYPAVPKLGCFFPPTSKSIINERKSILPILKLKRMKENLCWGVEVGHVTLGGRKLRVRGT